ncbi:hypothetical protein [Hoeflea sp.]|uniref:hypothetical protein n=1 Tax=Hoeflea sp. TaxID=1940281 RepID=UPI003BAE8000
MTAVVLHGRAAKTGFEIRQMGPPERRAPRNFAQGSDYIWTQEALFDFKLYSGTEEALWLTKSLLDAQTNEELGALASAYGHVVCGNRFDGGECSLISDYRDRVNDLRRLHDLLQDGHFSESDLPPSGLVYSPFSVGFSYWLVPSEGPRGFAPVLLTHSLYCFVCHEIISLALANRPLLVCKACGKFQRPTARRDSKFCSAKCRVAHHREREKAKILSNG